MRAKALWVVVITTLITGAMSFTATAAYAVFGAGFTTTVDGGKVNANLYQDKCDVYINGGPNNGVSNLTDGTYFFAVLAPGGQPDPNDGGAKLLSTDTRPDREFSVTDGHITTNLGTHSDVSDPSTTTVSDDLLLQLCDYDDTPNPGGVYILAICLIPSATSTEPVDPRDCKYDAFKVKVSGGRAASDLVAIKTANTSLTRTFAWTITKDVDRTSIVTNADTATFNYTVVVTSTGSTDSAFVVSGDIQVFNPNNDPVSGVSVTDAIGSTTCTVSGGSSTIAALDSTTFSYTCSFATNPGSGTNVATVTWDRTSIGSPTGSTTASAAFDFASATVTPVNDTINVDDTLVNHTLGDTVVSSGQIGTCTVATSPCTFNYSRTLSVPATGCYDYVNTAVIRQTGQSDSETVTVCRSNAGGFTMGFWRNKNGQAKIRTYATSPAPGRTVTLCQWLAQYPNVLPDLPSPCTGSSLAAYVATVIDLANASGDGIAMFKAQFLATALSAYFSRPLELTGIAVDAGIFGTSCMTVGNLLAFGNANYSTLITDKSTLMAVKTVYDQINNDIAITC